MHTAVRHKPSILSPLAMCHLLAAGECKSDCNVIFFHLDDNDVSGNFALRLRRISYLTTYDQLYLHARNVHAQAESMIPPTGPLRCGIGASQRSARVTSLKCDIIKVSCCCGQPQPEGNPYQGPVCICVTVCVCVCGLNGLGLMEHVHFGEFMRTGDGPRHRPV